MSIRSATYQQSVFKRYHSDKHLSEFHLQDGGKNQLADMEQNYVISSDVFVYQGPDLQFIKNLFITKSGEFRSFLVNGQTSVVLCI